MILIILPDGQSAEVKTVDPLTDRPPTATQLRAWVEGDFDFPLGFDVPIQIVWNEDAADLELPVNPLATVHYEQIIGDAYPEKLRGTVVFLTEGHRVSRNDLTPE